MHRHIQTPKQIIMKLLISHHRHIKSTVAETKNKVFLIFYFDDILTSAIL